VNSQHHGVAVIPPDGVQTTHGIDDHGAEVYATLLADPRRPTCRLDLFRVKGLAETVTGSHSHTEDELIHVTEGALQVGRHTVCAGMTIAVRNGRRYGFRTRGPFEFINYRSDISNVIMGTQKQPSAELAGRFLQS
jgi:hypothetical protein